MRLIDADALMEYCSNQKSKTISNNDIARFPTIEPSGDLISRADTLAKIKEYCIDGDDVVQKWFDTMGIEEVINTMPSVSADRPKGEWLYIENEPYSKCSECGAYIDDLDDDKYKYCPYCGADMRKDQDR